MSFDLNYKFWVGTAKELDDVVKRHEAFRRLKPVEKPEVQHYLFAELYARYVSLVNKLGCVYHFTFQVQKRGIIQGLLEAATCRVLELKNELKKIEMSEFIYIDKYLVEKRLTPTDVTVWTPKYFPFWRPVRIQDIINGKRTYDPKTGRVKEDDSERKSKVYRPSESFSARRSESVTQVDIKNLLRSQAQEQERVVVDPYKEKVKAVATMIQSHERARVDRKLIANMRYKPDVYKPKMRKDGHLIQYTFTHKPNQVMLLPVRRTKFEADYYVSRKDLKQFNFYVRPEFIDAQNTLLQDDVSDLGEGEEGEEGEEEIDGQGDEHSEGSELSDYDTESLTPSEAEELIRNAGNLAALKIQRLWRGYKDRKRYQKLLEQKSIIYGMAQPYRPNSIKIKKYNERMEDSVKYRLIKEKYDEEFIQFCQDERARILRIRGPWIMEDISDGIRAWFKEFYYKIGAFHPYPDEVKGGTLLLLRGMTDTPPDYLRKLKSGKNNKEELKKQKKKAKEMKKKEKEKLRKAKLAKEKDRARLKKLGFIDFNDEMEQSKSVAAIENILAKYKKEWQDIDETLNKKQEPIKEWITSDYYCEIHQELQLVVDGMMRIEYELLRAALAVDQKKKYKPPKKKKKRRKRGKKKKPPKDMTEDRSIESLFYELKQNGILKEYPKKTFDHFIGDRNNTAFDMLNIYMKDPPAYKGDIKDVLREVVLGMGPLNVPMEKAILLVGPTHSGKQLLCDILATEINAVVLDIGPENTAKYLDDMKYYIHIILKMAKILEPTILFIRNVHRLFWKKVPAEFTEQDPKMLSKFLKKQILKQLKTEDKIFLLATTDAPWTATGNMKSVFTKILLVPKTEYATSYILRRNVTLSVRSMPRNFNYFSAVALVTKEFSTGRLVKNIEETLCLQRRMTLTQKPLKPFEFVDNFLNKDPPEFPPEQREWDKFMKYYRKINKSVRARAKLMKAKQEILEKLKKMKKKK